MFDDELTFVEEDESEQEAHRSRRPNWKLVIVDDEHEIHNVTKLALGGFTFMDRGLDIFDAYNSTQAIEIMERESDVALMLLDVVMESEDAGFKVVRHVREKLRNQEVRIILRTGQPGSAPENRVIVDYDINDYKAKTELTSQKLFTAVVSSLRAYRDVRRIEASRIGLERVIDASVSIFQIQSIESFLSGMMMQISSILGLHDQSMLVIDSNEHETFEESLSLPRVLAGIGRFSGFANRTIDRLSDATVEGLIHQTKSERRTMSVEGRHLFFFCSKKKEFIFFIESEKVGASLDDIERNLVEIFCSNFAVAYDNLELHRGLNEATEELKKFSEGLELKVEERTRELNEALQRVEIEKQTALMLYNDLSATQSRLILAQQELVSRQKMAAVGVLAAGVAHEINNPNNFIGVGVQNATSNLASFKSFIDGLLDADTGDEVRQAFHEHFARIAGQHDVILEGSRRISAIVSGMNMITQLDRAEKQRVSMTAGIAELVSIFSARYEDIRFESVIETAKPSECWPAELNQGFMCVLDNAVRAIREKANHQIEAFSGEVIINVTAASEEVLVRIRDNGVGISSEQIENVFDPFFSSRTVGQGAGLGLSMTRDVIHKHEGEIRVKSVFGEWTEISIRLPYMD